MSFDNHLNYRIGPSLIWRIAQYGLGVPPSVSLPRLMTDLLLEIAQNAIKHGGAKLAMLQFGASSMTYSDDGLQFDIFALTDKPNGRGGSKALAEVLDCLVNEGYIELVAQTPHPSHANRYRISFPMLTTKIRETRENCSVEVRFGDAEELLGFDPECNLLFFDASEIVMYSRRFDVLESLQEVLDGERNLIIKCDSEREKTFYEGGLSAAHGKELTVIVAPMALFADS